MDLEGSCHLWAVAMEPSMKVQSTVQFLKVTYLPTVCHHIGVGALIGDYQIPECETIELLRFER